MKARGSENHIVKNTKVFWQRLTGLHCWDKTSKTKPAIAQQLMYCKWTPIATVYQTLFLYHFSIIIFHAESSALEVSQISLMYLKEVSSH